MSDAGWIQRAWTYAQRALESGDPEMQERIGDLALFPDQIDAIVRSFAEWHSNRGGADDAAWRNATSKRQGIPERAVVMRRAMGLIHLGFLEHVGQNEVMMHRKILAQVHEKKEAGQAALLLPKAVFITRALTGMQQQLRGSLQGDDRSAGAAQPILQALAAALEAIAQGREARAQEYCAALIHGIQDASRTIEDYKEQLRMEHAALEAMIEADAPREHVTEEESSSKDIVAQPAGNDRGQAEATDLFSMFSISRFREFLETKQAAVAQSLKSIACGQETVEALRESAGAQKQLVDAARHETRRLGGAIASGASDLSDDEMQRLLAQLQEARRAQQEAEAAHKHLEQEIAGLRQQISDQEYLRRLQEMHMNISFIVRAIRTTEEVMTDTLVWEGRYDLWEETHPEYTRMPEIGVAQEGGAATDDQSQPPEPEILAQYREALERIPFYRLYPMHATERLQSLQMTRHGHHRYERAEELFRNGINAHLILGAIHSYPNAWKNIVEREMRKHHEPQGVYRIPLSIEEGLREKEILTESNDISWERLSAWIRKETAS